MTSFWTSVVYPGIEPGKMEALGRAQPFIARGFLIATVLAGGVLGLSWASLKKGLSPSLLVLGLGVLLFADQIRVDDPFIRTMSQVWGQTFQQWSAPDPNVQYLLDRLETEEPFRVLAMGGNQFGQDVKPGMYGLELANGHHPNDLARYRELIGMAGSGAPGNLLDLRDGSPKLGLLSILNVRYIIWPVQRFGGLPTGEVVMATSMDGQNAYEAVYEIQTLPRARLVGEAVVLPEEDALGYLLSDRFRPEAEVVLTEESPLPLAGSELQGRVQWTERGPNRMRVTTESSGNALLVIADNWFPAWKARVDGTDAPVLRANHSLRAVPVSAGTHEVELFFDAGTLKGALFTSLASLALLGALAGVGVLQDRKMATGAQEGDS